MKQKNFMKMMAVMLTMSMLGTTPVMAGEGEEKVTLTLDRYEHSIMIQALHELRNDMLANHQITDDVDDVLLKTFDAPVTKKVKWRDEAR